LPSVLPPLLLLLLAPLRHPTHGFHQPINK